MRDSDQNWKEKTLRRKPQNTWKAKTSCGKLFPTGPFASNFPTLFVWSYNGKSIPLCDTCKSLGGRRQAPHKHGTSGRDLLMFSKPRCGEAKSQGNMMQGSSSTDGALGVHVLLMLMINGKCNFRQLLPFPISLPFARVLKKLLFKSLPWKMSSQKSSMLFRVFFYLHPQASPGYGNGCYSQWNPLQDLVRIAKQLHISFNGSTKNVNTNVSKFDSENHDLKYILTILDMSSSYPPGN